MFIFKEYRKNVVHCSCIMLRGFLEKQTLQSSAEPMNLARMTTNLFFVHQRGLIIVNMEGSILNVGLWTVADSIESLHSDHGTGNSQQSVVKAVRTGGFCGVTGNQINTTKKRAQFPHKWTIYMENAYIPVGYLNVEEKCSTLIWRTCRTTNWCLPV